MAATLFPSSWSRDRFYRIDGRSLPSVTTVLDIIAKPALGPWYAKEERRFFESAMLEVLTRPGARDPEYVLAAVAQAVTGVKAADREKQKARTIGTAIHAGIEWLLRTRLGEDAGPEPLLPDPAAWAVESWKDWAAQVRLEPLAIERTVFCARCGYAGTLDLYARVRGILTVVDWKSGKAIYPEAFLQNVAYRHAATRAGLPVEQGLIVRLPKLLDDPAWEVMPVPEELRIEDFQAALALWRWPRLMDAKPIGHRPTELPCRTHDAELDATRAVATSGPTQRGAATRG
jgi:hypothetical protein